MLEFLLNPNVAYLALVICFLVTLLAILSPGTGLLEIGAIFSFLPAAYAAYYLPINWWALAVLILAIVPFLYAVRKPRRTWYLVIAIACALVGSTFLFREESWQPAVHPLLALVVSLLMTVFLWFTARKTLEANQHEPAHIMVDIIGAVGETRTPVSTEGSAYIKGEMWSVHSKQPIPAGTRVQVTRRDGFILEVEPKPVEKLEPAEPKL